MSRLPENDRATGWLAVAAARCSLTSSLATPSQIIRATVSAIKGGVIDALRFDGLPRRGDSICSPAKADFNELYQRFVTVCEKSIRHSQRQLPGIGTNKKKYRYRKHKRINACDDFCRCFDAQCVYMPAGYGLPSPHKAVIRLGGVGSG